MEVAQPSAAEEHGNGKDARMQQLPSNGCPQQQSSVGNKLFIGGVSYETSDRAFLEYFQTFGKMLDCVLMREPGGGVLARQSSVFVGQVASRVALGLSYLRTPKTPTRCCEPRCSWMGADWRRKSLCPRAKRMQCKRPGTVRGHLPLGWSDV